MSDPVLPPSLPPCLPLSPGCCCLQVRGQVAVRYNDKSPNENMHVSMAFQLALEDPDINIFAGLSDAQYKEVRGGLGGVRVRTCGRGMCVKGARAVQSVGVG